MSETEVAWITAEKDCAGVRAGCIASLIPGSPDPFNITLTAIVSGPPGSVEVMKRRFPTLSRTPLEFMESYEIGEGDEVLRQMTAELENRGFQLVGYGPSWFQRRFEREYRPGEIDYSDNAPLELEEAKGSGCLGCLIIALVVIVLIIVLNRAGVIMWP